MPTHLKWSAPFHGVQHLGEFSLREHWVTVTDYRSFAELTLWFPGCGFSPTHSNHATPAEARAAGEAYMAQHSKQICTP